MVRVTGALTLVLSETNLSLGLVQKISQLSCFAQCAGCRKQGVSDASLVDKLIQTLASERQVSPNRLRMESRRHTGQSMDGFLHGPSPASTALRGRFLSRGH